MSLLLALLLFASPAAAQEDVEARTMQYILDAADLIDAGRCPEALGLLESAVRLRPDARRAWLFKASCHADLKEWDAAAAALDRFEGFELSAREAVEASALRDRLPVAEPVEEPAEPPAEEPVEPPAEESSPATEPVASENATEPAPPIPEATPARPASQKRRQAGVVLLAAGGAAAGVGAGLMGHGWSLKDDHFTWDQGFAEYHSGTAALIAGGVAAGTGILLSVLPGKPVVAAAVDPRSGRVEVVFAARW